MEKENKCLCGSELPQYPVLCSICDLSPLCLRCTISNDISICENCIKEQNASLVKYDNIPSIVCFGCNKVEVKNSNNNNTKYTPNCIDCKHYYCNMCVNDPYKHACSKCNIKDCFNIWKTKCTCNFSKKYCDSCYLLHINTNCPFQTAYKCKGCGNDVLLFGDVKFKCPIENCQRIYGCHFCSQSLKEKIYCCFEHISPKRCGGCHYMYPLDGVDNAIILRRLIIPNVKFVSKYRIFCKQCYHRIKTFVNCIIYNSLLQHKIEIPKVVMEKIIFLSLYRL